MSTEISVSNSTQQNCNELLKIMQKYRQDCRVIPMDTFKDKTQLVNLWKIMKKNGNYNCAYIKIDGGFSGCINYYIGSQL